MDRARVLDALGRELTPCAVTKAFRLVSAGRATLVAQDPLTIRLHRQLGIPQPQTTPTSQPLAGQCVLLHICCGPCATYTVTYLQEAGARVTGYWYNPNIHPYGEHERRREALRGYAEAVGLSMIWESGYEMTAFLRGISEQEEFRERCVICYRLRLERTARAAADGGFSFFTTTLLISPYQDLDAIRRGGESAAKAVSSRVAHPEFYFENLRKGFATHHHLARECGLYRQRYCGCVYSEWEAQDPKAWTHPRRKASPGA